MNENFNTKKAFAKKYYLHSYGVYVNGRCVATRWGRKNAEKQAQPYLRTIFNNNTYKIDLVDNETGECIQLQ